jgi:hypothetical protein
MPCELLTGLPDFESKSLNSYSFLRPLPIISTSLAADSTQARRRATSGDVSQSAFYIEEPAFTD